MKKVTIYTDGACSGNPGPGGWGAILMYGDHKLEISGGEPQTTNNRMELTGPIEALKKLNLLMAERSRIVSGDAKLDAEAKELAIKFGSILAILSMLSSFVFSVIYWVLK